jgi:hypothetical protein
MHFLTLCKIVCHIKKSIMDFCLRKLIFHCLSANYQQLKFPNNFPKAFPEAPVAGHEVRLECVAFG